MIDVPFIQTRVIFVLRSPKILHIMAFQALALAIRNMLLEGEVVHLPGIGRLSLEYYPAKLSRIESTIYPPSKRVVYYADESQSADNGKIIEHYSKALKSLTDQQDRSLEADLNALASLVVHGERVELMEVGTFFSNEKNETDFIASGFNYHLDVYGLGKVNARPIQRRSAAQAATEAIVARGGVLPKKHVKPILTLKDRLFLPALAVVFVLALGACIWLIFAPSPQFESEANVLTEPLLAQETEQYTSEDELRAGTDVLDVDSLDEQDELAAPLNTITPVQEEPGATPDSKTNVPFDTVTIVVGHFGDPANVRRVQERLTQLGLENSAAMTPKKLTRVQVHLNPDISDPDQILAMIKKDFDKGAWILK